MTIKYALPMESFLFAQNLIDKIIDYFKKKYGQDISPEIANEYLISLANLYESFIEFTQVENETY